MNKQQLTFPKDFWWGSAWSAEQSEDVVKQEKQKLYGNDGIRSSPIGFINESAQRRQQITFIATKKMSS